MQFPIRQFRVIQSRGRRLILDQGGQLPQQREHWAAYFSHSLHSQASRWPFRSFDEQDPSFRQSLSVCLLDCLTCQGPIGPLSSLLFSPVSTCSQVNGPPSLSDGLSPPETPFNPLPSRSISEPTLPLAFHTPQTSHGVAILGNTLCTRVGKALLAACPLIFRPLTGVIDIPAASSVLFRLPEKSL